MWIELPDEIIENIKEITNPLDKSIIIIDTLFTSMIKCQHIIFGSETLLKYLERCDLISPTNRKFIQWIRQQYIYVYECYEILPYKINVILQGDTIKRVGDIFYVPLKFLYEVRETKLLSENENDALLFLNIFSHVNKVKKLSSNFSIRFENDSFHGGNAPSKLNQAIIEERIMICLIDSDKLYVNGKHGDTYRGANDVYKKIKNNHVIHMKELNVREKENLIPPRLYLCITENCKVLLEILDGFIDNENIMKFFDLKDGDKFKNTTDENWLSNYQEIFDKCIEKEIYIEPPEDMEGRESYLCIKGIGAKLCDLVNAMILDPSEKYLDYMEQHSVDENKKMLINDFRDKVMDVLPEYLKKEWEEIFNLLFSWGCCLSKDILPTYGLE